MYKFYLTILFSSTAVLKHEVDPFHTKTGVDIKLAAEITEVEGSSEEKNSKEDSKEDGDAASSVFGRY